MLTACEQKIIGWLRKVTVATMKQIRHEFEVSHMTVVRALKEFGYYASYNYNENTRLVRDHYTLQRRERRLRRRRPRTLRSLWRRPPKPRRRRIPHPHPREHPRAPLRKAAASAEHSARRCSAGRARGAVIARACSKRWARAWCVRPVRRWAASSCGASSARCPRGASERDARSGRPGDRLPP